MYDPLFVGGGKAASDLQPIVDRLSLRQGNAVNSVAQGFTFKQLGDYVGCSVMRTDLMNDENIGMIETAGGSRLLFKPTEPIFIGRKRRGQHFYRHISTDLRVVSTIHLAHAPGSDLGIDPVVCKRTSDPLVGHKFLEENR